MEHFVDNLTSGASMCERYKNRYVAFVDILGFEELINNSSTKNEAFGIIVNSLKKIAKFEGVQNSVSVTNS